MTSQISGIVLAAGESTRMGRPKQHLPFGAGTLLEWAVAQAVGSELDEVIVVVGPAGADLSFPDARVVVNEAPWQGSASSLRAGIAAAPGNSVMVLLGDMPGVRPIIINRLLDAWKSGPAWGAVTQYSDSIGHPYVLSSYLAASLEGKTGDKVLWPMLAGAADEEVRRVPINHPRPLDVNTPEDYVLVCQQAGFEPG